MILPKLLGPLKLRWMVSAHSFIRFIHLQFAPQLPAANAQFALEVDGLVSAQKRSLK